MNTFLLIFFIYLYIIYINFIFNDVYIVRIFAEHGIKFNNHRYGYTSEYTCPGCLMQFDSVTWFFRTRRAEFDEKAKEIMNDICKILPKNEEFDWQGKTVDGCIRNGTVRFAR